MAVVNREDNCYHPSLQSFTTKFFRRDVFVCCHFSNSHSLFNPMQSTSALCLFWKCIHKVTNDLSLLQIPYWHCPTLTFCPLWSTCLDDHSFSLRFSLHLDTLQSPGSFCLAVRFCGPLFLGWSHHCQCPVLGLLSISLHVYSLGISSAPTASNAIHVCFLKIFMSRLDLSPELRISLSKCILQAHLDASLFTSIQRTKLNPSSLFPRPILSSPCSLSRLMAPSLTDAQARGQP